MKKIPYIHEQNSFEYKILNRKMVRTPNKMPFFLPAFDEWNNLVRNPHEEHACCSFCLFSAAIAAATEGGKCLRLSVSFSSEPSAGFSSASGTAGGAVANKDSMSFNVKKGSS